MGKLFDWNDLQIKNLLPLCAAINNCLGLLDSRRAENHEEARFDPYLVEDGGQDAISDQTQVAGSRVFVR